MVSHWQGCSNQRNHDGQISFLSRNNLTVFIDRRQNYQCGKTQSPKSNLKAVISYKKYLKLCPERGRIMQWQNPITSPRDSPPHPPSTVKVERLKWPEHQKNNCTALLVSTATGVTSKILMWTHTQKKTFLFLDVAPRCLWRTGGH